MASINTFRSGWEDKGNSKTNRRRCRFVWPKKRPELITMVEELYRAHRSLAERYDQVKSDNGSRLLTTRASPLSSTKYRADKLMSSTERSCDSYSETCEHDEPGDSEVDDPEQEEESEFKKEVEEEVSTEVGNDEVMKLREELDKLKEENKLQWEQLMQKDEKREAVRQLSFAMDMLKEDNMKLRKIIADKETTKQKSPLEFNKLKEVFLGRLFNGFKATD